MTYRRELFHSKLNNNFYLIYNNTLFYLVDTIVQSELLYINTNFTKKKKKKFKLNKSFKKK